MQSILQSNVNHACKSRLRAPRMASMYLNLGVSSPASAIVAPASSAGRLRNCPGGGGAARRSKKGKSASPKWCVASRGSSAGRMSTPSIRIPRPSRGCSACDQMQSDAIRCNQMQSDAIRCHQRSSVVLSDDLHQCQRQSDALRGPQRSSKVIKGNQKQSDALRGPHLRCRIVHKEGLIDGRSPHQSFHSAAHVACEVGDHHESLVARGAQGGQLMGIAISMHSEAQSACTQRRNQHALRGAISMHSEAQSVS